MDEASPPTGVTCPLSSRAKAGLTFAVLAILITVAFALSLAIGPAAANLSALFGELRGEIGRASWGGRV